VSDKPKINPKLTDEQKKVLFEKATEAPFSGKYVTNNQKGMYTCANCGAMLFSTDSQFESKEAGLAGWPSFAEVAKSDAVELKDDNSLGIHRTEVICKNCGGHLGHYFEGVKDHPSGVHYCINSCALDFKPKAKK
jgi:peptide-methionine (R)-S-oxide reductase